MRQGRDVWATCYVCDLQFKSHQQQLGANSKKQKNNQKSLQIVNLSSAVNWCCHVTSLFTKCCRCRSCKNVTDSDLVAPLLIAEKVTLLSEIKVVQRYDAVVLFSVNKQRRCREGSSLRRYCTISSNSLMTIFRHCGLSWMRGSACTVLDRKVLETSGNRTHPSTSTMYCCRLHTSYFSQRTAAS